MRNGWTAQTVLKEVTQMESAAHSLTASDKNTHLFIEGRNNKLHRLATLPISMPSRSFGRISLSPARCDRVLVKNNLRAFYFKMKQTAKIMVRPDQPDGFAAETKNRTVLDGFSHLSAPQILEASTDEKWIIEELVTGRPATLSDIEHPAVMEEIWALHERGSTLETAQIDFEDMPPLDAATAGFIEKINGKAYPYIKGFIHGDFSLGNMLVSQDGKIVLLDWERSETGNIIDDLLPLSAQSPVLRAFISRQLAIRLKNEGAAEMPLEFYQTLVYLDRLKHLPEMRDYFRKRDGHDGHFDKTVGKLQTNLQNAVKLLAENKTWELI